MDHAQIIADLGGPARTADLIQVSKVKPYHWRKRGRIPAQYWPRLIEAARSAGVQGVTLDGLAAAFAPAQRETA